MLTIMPSNFLIYGANGYVGSHIARLAVKSGLQPVIAGRDEYEIRKLARELKTDFRIIDLTETRTLDNAVANMELVLHCAGPYIHTYKPMVDSCLRTCTHYLDLTGEISVFRALAALDAEARLREIMILPGIGFDVAATDCLAVHLKKRLPSATHLKLAFHSKGPAGLPPGTQRTIIELIPFGDLVRKNGNLIKPTEKVSKKKIDFGYGPVEARRLLWGDIFTAFYSTGIPNIENYSVLSKAQNRQLDMLNFLRPVLSTNFVRNILRQNIKAGPSFEDLEKTSTHVWGEVFDENGLSSVSRLHGPEAGVIWTSRTAIAAVKRILNSPPPSGFQTPGMAFGSDFVLECDGVTREDLD